MNRTALVSVCSALLVGAAALPAGAAPPTIERWEIEEHFYDEWVSEQCGFEVNGHWEGFAAVRIHDRAGTGPLDVFTINTTLTLYSDHGSYKLKDVGTDRGMMRPDGTVDVSIVGQVPFAHKGLIRVNPETGEVIHEPQRLTEDEVWRVCDALAP
jgi:hypothetical protein